MRRIDMVELHDHPRFPVFLRNLITEALQALWEIGNSYHPILLRLYASLSATSTAVPAEVLDLCSGSGGPWLRLSRELGRTYRFSVHVCLTDKYPNRRAFEQTRHMAQARVDRQTDLDYISRSIDAISIPSNARGFQTIFSSFHHFGPAEARKILQNAIEGNQGIGIFELANRSPKTLLILCLTPVLVLLLTPRIRPFRWSRLFWTYIIPVVPFVIWLDGFASCLRAYALEELNEMVEELARTPSGSKYQWQSGEERTGLLPVTYLIAYPTSDPLAEAAPNGTAA
jgi:hypothetical protein